MPNQWIAGVDKLLYKASDAIETSRRELHRCGSFITSIHDTSVAYEIALIQEKKRRCDLEHDYGKVLQQLHAATTSNLSLHEELEQAHNRLEEAHKTSSTLEEELEQARRTVSTLKAEAENCKLPCSRVNSADSGYEEPSKQQTEVRREVDINNTAGCIVSAGWKSELGPEIFDENEYEARGM